jgi:hypothetical protein
MLRARYTFILLPGRAAVSLSATFAVKKTTLFSEISGQM